MVPVHTGAFYPIFSRNISDIRTAGNYFFIVFSTLFP
jgi:hypothetical protein